MALLRLATQVSRTSASPAGLRIATRQASSSAGASAASRASTESIFTSRAAGIASSLVAVGTFTVYSQVYGLSLLPEAKAMTVAEEGLHPPAFPWSHAGAFETYDHNSIRRGYQVYREVCSTCHSLNRIAWRNLVGVSHTVDEVKGMAEEVEYEDGPDDEGGMFQRPGKLSDYFPKPYANDEAARAGNAGALPPDLSLITKARHGGADYIMALITGYVDPPAGVEIREGLNYNPYFPGGAIGMARVLYDGLVEYPDGTPATTTQMAKDVVTFLSWAAEPEHDQRKKMGMQSVIILSALFALSIYVKRQKWAGIKTRQIVYNPPKSKH